MTTGYSRLSTTFAYVGLLLVLPLSVAVTACASYPDGAWLYGGMTRGVEDGLRQFEWPPPRYTTFHRVPDRVLLRESSKLGRVFELIGIRLSRAGLEGSTFGVGEDGFAVVTSIRCIDEQGRNTRVQGPACLDPNKGLRQGFSFGDYLNALFGASPGHYRMFVVVVTPRPLAPKRDTESWGRAVDSWTYGHTHLPGAIANRDAPDGTAVLILVYEFERASVSDRSARLVLSSSISAREHIVHSGLFSGDELI
jgi:hypothetical protein